MHGYILGRDGRPACVEGGKGGGGGQFQFFNVHRHHRRTFHPDSPPLMERMETM